MIGWVSKTKKADCVAIDFNQLLNNIRLIKKINNEVCNYLVELFYEYESFLQENCSRAKLINENLNTIYGKNLVDYSDNIDSMNNCRVIVSPSHDNTYYVLKTLNEEKKQKVMIISFDMHSDAYDYNDELWKGNVFAKLIKEGLIENILVVGIPSNKIASTIDDISIDIRNKVNIVNGNSIEEYILKLKPDIIYLSIDIDCLDTRRSRYTALEYCPTSALANLSKIDLDLICEEEIIHQVNDCVFVKNELGYSNLYKTGENWLDVEALEMIISKIKNLADEHQINLGFNYKNNHIMGEITEVAGYDYGNLTSKMIVKLIDILI
jgi:hypothetical protein